MLLRYFLFSFVPLGALLICVGCEIREKGEKTTTVSAGVAAARPSRLTVSLLRLDSPNHYAVHLKAAPREKAILYRGTQNEVAKAISLIERPGMTGLGIDEEVTAGMTYHYWLVEKEEPAPQPNDPPDGHITIPEDVLIRQDMAIESIRTSGRIFLERATLQSKERLLHLEADELISDNGVVQSFPTATQASTGSNGRDGGLIYIKVRKAKGKLLIAARGEDGGNGAPGKKGERGKAGIRGDAAEIAVRQHFPPPVKEVYQRLLIKLPDGTDPLHRDWEKLFYCAKPPGDGGKGEPGAKGEPGQNGGRGGDSARLWVEIFDASELELAIEKTPGRGGPGGKGGSGGEGGLGGEPGLIDRHHLCPKAKMGETGTTGPEGITGAVGPPGVVGAFCLQLARSKVGDCTRAPHFDPHVK